MKTIWMLAAGEGEGGPDVEGQELGNAPVAELETGDGIVGIPADGTEPTTPTTPKPGGGMPLILLGAMLVFIYLMMFRGPKKKQKQHSNMVKALQKNDRVKTIGGIIGTIIDVKDDFIVLKIDESNNTKIKVVAGAISGKLSDE
jgi:preprotein translocase subunit YajC